MNSLTRFGLYVHWPFCQAKCPYCDFNSHVVDSINEKRWKTAFLSELRRVAAETEGWVIDTIFFGGGTPSLMSPDMVGDIISEARYHWETPAELEITLEANPTSVEYDKFQNFSEVGVNRLSLGIQSLRDIDLRRLGRMHSRAEALSALEIAQEVFPRYSFDLIYARQYQSLSDWEAELSEALDYVSGHVSLYQLTIEPGTVFGERYKRKMLPGLPDEDLSADMYILTQEMTSEKDLLSYEVSNHARPGCESRHNLIYWTGGNYIGIGPGAHGRYSKGEERFSTETLLNPQEWVLQVEQTGTGNQSVKPLDNFSQATEYIMMGLRLRDGIHLNKLRELNYAVPYKELENLQDDNLIEIKENRVRVTEHGRLLLNAVVKQLLV